MLSDLIVATALLTSPFTIGLAVLWSAHRGYMASNPERRD